MSAITAEKGEFALQIYNNLFPTCSSITCAKQISIDYSLFYNALFFKYVSNYLRYFSHSQILL